MRARGLAGVACLLLAGCLADGDAGLSVCGNGQLEAPED